MAEKIEKFQKSNEDLLEYFDGKREIDKSCIQYWDKQGLLLLGQAQGRLEKA